MALGEATAELDYALIERACIKAVRESATLDWKQELPLTAGRDEQRARQHQQQELAKDVAAMANTGGGMIVYGVAEVRSPGTSAADHIEPVGAVDETTFRAIRQVAGTLVYPPVAGLQLLPLSPADKPSDGVLVLLVPDSPEAPHLVHPSNGRDWFGAPYRHGPDTEWMVERQLASAYAAREAGRRRRTEDFDSRFDTFTSTLPGDSHVTWVVAQAVPDVPLPRPRELQLPTANGIINRAWSSPIVSSFGPRDLTNGAPTRRGLRRFTRQGQRNISAAPGAVARGHIEIHGDGTVIAAFTRDGAIPGEGRQFGQVPIDDIEATAMDFFALVWQTRQDLNVTSDYIARLAVLPQTQIFRRPDPVLAGHLQPWDEEHRVYGYAPVDGPILTGEGLAEALASWIDITSDAVNQTGAAGALDVNQILTELWLED